MNIRIFFCVLFGLLLGAACCLADMQYQDLNVAFKDSTPIHVQMRNGLFLLPIKVNGSAEPYYFLVDTGCEISMIDSTVAKKLGIGGLDSIDMYGVGSKSAKTAMTDLITLDTPDFSITGARMAITSALHSQNIAGLFGFDIMRHTVFKLDYVNQTVTFFDPTRFTDTQQTQVSLGVMGTSPRIEITVVKDGVPYTTPVVVDTGDAGGVSLTKDFMADNPTLTIDNSHMKTYVGVGGEDQEQEGTVQEVHLGDQIVKTPPANLLNNYNGGGFGLVGAGVLSHFDVTFDLPDSLLLLRPNGSKSSLIPAEGVIATSATTAPATQPADAPQSLSAQGAGFQVNQANGSFIVTSVAVPHSGIHVGDLITQIDKTRTAGLDMAHMVKLLQSPIRWICIERDGSDMQIRMTSIVQAPVQTAVAPDSTASQAP